MPFWVIYYPPDNPNHPLHSGPYQLTLQAQRYADRNVKMGKYDIVETRSASWPIARGEVLQKLTEKYHDMGKGRMRIYESRRRYKGTKSYSERGTSDEGREEHL